MCTTERVSLHIAVQPYWPAFVVHANYRYYYQRVQQYLVRLRRKIKVLFISKAGSEGLDLKNTSNIIIMESGWNENSMEQIIGRGVRYKSHESLPKSKRAVTVYRLYAIKPNEYKNIKKITSKHLLELKDNKMMSVDLYLRNYSWLKQQELDKFEKELVKYSKK